MACKFKVISRLALKFVIHDPKKIYNEFIKEPLQFQMQICTQTKHRMKKRK